MNSAVHALTQSIAGKESLEAWSLETLQQLANQYPFFGPVQLLLAEKLKDGNPDVFDKQVQRASLHFYNPLWLDQLLNSQTSAHKQLLPDSKPVEIPVQAELEVPATREELVDQTHETFTEEEGEEELVEEESASVPPLPQVKMPEIPGLKIAPIDPATAELSFEPYHTVDYFASQGIRFREEEKPKDRFSQQLKSFTEWLQTMKKIPPAELTTLASTGTDEQKVEQMAQHSITDREVITEAMAEVWEKQGDNTKAIEVYEKLSLLDPGKSSYFAAKIEHLKQL